VSCVDEQGKPVARGLVNYNSEEAGKLLGKSTDHIIDVLGYDGDHELIHRDNLILM